MKATTIPATRLKKLFIVFTIFLASFSEAQDSKPIRTIPMQSCEKDRIQFCGDKKEPLDIDSCLIKHDKDISLECKQEFERLLQMKKQAMSRGGGALSSFGGLNAMGPPISLISYDGRYGPKANSTSLIENKLNLSSPVYKSQTDTVSLSLAGSNYHLGNSIILNSGKKVPADFYRIETGAQYFKQLPEKRNWGLRTSVGYSGEKPFKNSNEITYSLNAHYGFPGSTNAYWMLAIYFSNNSSLGNFIPIPGFSYIYRTETFTGIFGFPILSMQWTPVFPWVFSLSIFGPTIQTEIGYGSIDRFQIYSGLYWNRQSYIPSERTNAKDRLTIEEKKAAIGLRTPIWGSTLGEVQVGKAFDRSIYIGNGFSNKDGGSVSIESGLYLSSSIKVKF